MQPVRRRRVSRWSLRALAVLAVFPVGAAGAPAAGAGVPESTYQDLHWRLLGPFRGGWATVAAGIPGDPTTFYFGGADGGVWRTTDAGVTWRPIFDRERAASIGALAVAPSDPRVLWVGTGQVHQRWDIVAGEGIYRSTDGGATWSHRGLEATRHVGRIWVDPRDADVALVAALGRVFGPNRERGVFRTEDGGASWTHVLYANDDTGAVDLAADAETPDVVYVALWQVRRHPWLDYFQPTEGAGSGVRKSVDGGRTWARVGERGWPAGPLGRIALAVAPKRGGARVFAGIQGHGLYRSDDGGESWEQVSADASLVGSYMAALTPDPRDPEVLWSGGRGLRRSTDGGRTFTIEKGAPGGDDYHFVWIVPGAPRRMIVGADQGAVLTVNGGESWSSWYNQPTGQFYRLAADQGFPYRVYSGQQDSGTVAIATRSDYGQLTFRDWHPVGGDERDGDVPDPLDPNLVYGAGLGGRLSKWDARTGQAQNVAPWPVSSYGARPGTARHRYDWITPLAVSARPPHALYLGAQVLFRSLDRGASWETVSPDLTGAAPGATGCDGDVPVERATACGYGAIFAIAPSPAADGTVWVGTTNGRVHVTRDDGARWSEVTPPGLADWAKVNSIDLSPTDPNLAYVAADRHRADDARPYAWRTRDGGATWTAIGGGLPADEWVGVVRHDPERPGLLFAGTQRGVHVSFDDGASWQSLRLDLPTSGINDLLVVRGDVVIATQGRGLWSLDAIAPLRHAGEAALAAGAFLAPPAPAARLRLNQNRDTPLPPEEPRAANPPVGAVLDYLLPAGATGAVAIEIVDAGGRLVRRFASDEAPAAVAADVYFADLWRGEPPRPATGPGHHRFVWDLRRTPPPVLEAEYSIAALPGRPTPTQPQGALVVPGLYTARLVAGGDTVERPLEVVPDPRVAAPVLELAALDGFYREVEHALARAVDLARHIEAREPRQAEPGATDRRSRRDPDRERRELEAARGERADSAAGVAADLAALATDLEAADAAPTAPQRALLDDARGRLDRAEARWLAYERGGPASRR